MALCKPIEVVVIRDLVLRPRRSEAAAVEEFSIPVRQVDGVMDVFHESIRQRILLVLATAGSLPVAELARRLGADPKSLSHHLQPMRASEVIFSKRHGRQQHYDLTPGRVIFERFPAGGFSLTVNAHDGGVGVMITVRP